MSLTPSAQRELLDMFTHLNRGATIDFYANGAEVRDGVHYWHMWKSLWLDVTNGVVVTKKTINAPPESVIESP